MIPVISLLLVMAFSLLVIRVAAVALLHTGMGREAARFQARSAFTGAGFTTSESEDVVGHPVRRRIVMWLMLVGNIGIVAAMSSLLLSFLHLEEAPRAWIPLGVLFGGLTLLIAAASSRWVDRMMSAGISWALDRWTSIDARDYAKLLHLREDYGVTELRVESGDWVAGRTLDGAGLTQEGILVLGIECPGGSFIGAPGGDTEIRAGDRLSLYGRLPRIAELDRRIAGDDGVASHAEAVGEQQRVATEERSRAGR